MSKGVRLGAKASGINSKILPFETCSHKCNQKWSKLGSILKLMTCFLWPPCIADVDIIFLSSFFFFSSLNLSDHRMDVYHTSTHGVALVRI